MTNASAGLRQQHGYHRCFYRRMFKVSIRVAVKIWFGIDVTATPGACSFHRSSTFCNSWRNAFNYNRTVSNRTEFVERSPCAKYAATGNIHALNLGNHGFCRDGDTTFDRTRNHRRSPKTGSAHGRAEHRFTARETKSQCPGLEKRYLVAAGRMAATPPFRDPRKPELSASCRTASRRPRA